MKAIRCRCESAADRYRQFTVASDPDTAAARRHLTTGAQVGSGRQTSSKSDGCPRRRRAIAIKRFSTSGTVMILPKEANGMPPRSSMKTL